MNWAPNTPEEFQLSLNNRINLKLPHPRGINIYSKQTDAYFDPKISHLAKKSLFYTNSTQALKALTITLTTPKLVQII